MESRTRMRSPRSGGSKERRVLHRISLVMAVVVCGLSLLVGQQRTWFVNNTIGSDTYSGLSESPTGGTSGPKRTLTGTLPWIADGDEIVVNFTGIPYGSSSGEDAIVQIAARQLTVRAAGGVVEISSGVEVNIPSSVAPQRVTIDGVGFRLTGGLWLTAGEVRNLSSKLEVAGSITRTRGRLMGRPSYSGSLDFYYNTQLLTTMGDEFPLPGDSLACRNLIVTGLFPLIATQSMNVNGSFVLRTALDLGGGTLRLRQSQGFVQHLVRGSIGNGTLECVVLDSMTLDATGVSLPHVIIRSHPASAGSSLLLRSSSLRSLSTHGETNVAVNLSGITSFGAPDIAGPIIHTGSGHVTIDRSTRSVLYMGGSVQLLGEGRIEFPAVTASGIVISGDVVVGTSITLRQTEVLRHRAIIRFGDALTTITGVVRNATAIRGSDGGLGCDSTGLIILEASNSGVSIGSVSNEAIISAGVVSGGYGMHRSANIQFGFRGDQSGSFVVGAVSNGAQIEVPSDEPDKRTAIGNILFTQVVRGTVEIGSLTNRTAVGPGMNQQNCGAILFPEESLGELTVRSILSTGDRGGETILAGHLINVQEGLINERVESGGSLSLILNTGSPRAVVKGSVQLLGGSDLRVVSRGNPILQIEGDVHCRGAGALRFSSGGSSFLQILGNLLQTDGVLEFSRGGALLEGTKTGPDTVVVKGNVTIERGIIDAGSAPRYIILQGGENLFGASDAVRILEGDKTTLQLESGDTDVDLQRVEFTGGETVFPGDFVVTSGRNIATSVILRGARCRVKGSVRFGDAETDVTVQLDGLRLTVEGPQGVFNQSGYQSVNGGILTLAGDDQLISGKGSFADIEVATSSTVSVMDGVGPFGGRIVLTSGVVEGSGKIVIGNSTSYPQIDRGDGSFDAAPVFASPVSILYAGVSKVASYELPADSTKLHDLRVQAPQNVPGARSVIQLAEPITVNGTLRVDAGQALALRRFVNLTVRGARIVADGNIINSPEEEGSLVLASQEGTTISGGGYLPTLLVLTERGTLAIRGVTALASGLYGEDFVIGTGDDLDLTTTNATGDLLVRGSENQIFLDFGAGVGSHRSQVRNLWLEASQKSVMLSSDLTVAGSWKSLEGVVDIGRADLFVRGQEMALRGTTFSGTTGSLKLQPPSSTSIAIQESANLPSVPVRVVTGTPHSWQKGQTVLLEGHTGHPILRDGVYRISSVLGGDACTLEDLEGSLIVGNGGPAGSGGQISSVQVLRLFPFGSRVPNLGSRLEVDGDDSTSRLVLDGSENSSPLLVQSPFRARSARISLGWQGRPNDLILRTDSATFERNVVFDRTGKGSFVIAGGEQTQLVLADTLRCWNLRIQSNATLVGDARWLEIGGLFLLEAGDFNLQHSTLAVTGSFSYLGGGLTSATGHVLLQGAVVRIGPSSLTVQSLIMQGAPSTLEGSGDLVVKRRFELNTVGSVILGESGKPLLTLEGNAELHYRRGLLSEVPHYGGQIRLFVSPFSSIGIPSSLWPTEPQNLVSHLTILAGDRFQIIRLPGERRVSSLLDLRRGTLDLSTPGERLILLGGATIQRSDLSDIRVGDQSGQNLVIGDSTTVEYRRMTSDSLTVGPELPPLVRKLVFKREEGQLGGPTVLSRSVSVLDSLILGSDVVTRRGATISVSGDVVITWDPELASAKEPALQFEEPLRFVGSRNQSIVVPTQGASIGSFRLEKDIRSGNVSLKGGSLSLREGAVMILSNGVFFTGEQTLHLRNPILPVLDTEQGFLRIETGGQKSHVAGTVRKQLKIGNSNVRAQTVFPVGDSSNYRPLTLMFVRESMSEPVMRMEAFAAVNHVNERPEGSVGFPIPDGIAPGVPITGTGRFFWRVVTSETVSDTPYSLALTAAGVPTSEVNADDVVANRIKIVRREGLPGDGRMPWELQGGLYDSYVIGSSPTVNVVNAMGNLTSTGVLFSYGLKVKLFVQHPLVPEGGQITLTDERRVLDLPLEGDRPLFGGRTGLLTYEVVSDDTSAVTVQALDQKVLRLRGLRPSGSVRIRVVARDQDGSQAEYTFAVIVSGVTSLEKEPIVPTNFALFQNYPNPFNPSTSIVFGLPRELPVTIEIFNILGEQVRRLVDGETLNSSYYTVVWDGTDDAGQRLGSGVYMLRLHAGEFNSTLKMIIMR